MSSGNKAKDNKDSKVAWKKLAESWQYHRDDFCKSGLHGLNIQDFGALHQATLARDSKTLKISKSWRIAIANPPYGISNLKHC